MSQASMAEKTLHNYLTDGDTTSAITAVGAMLSSLEASIETTAATPTTPAEARLANLALFTPTPNSRKRTAFADLSDSRPSTAGAEMQRRLKDVEAQATAATEKLSKMEVESLDMHNELLLLRATSSNVRSQLMLSIGSRAFTWDIGTVQTLPGRMDQLSNGSNQCRA